MIPTFDHRPLINQRAERPAMQRAKGGAEHDVKRGMGV